MVEVGASRSTGRSNAITVDVYGEDEQLCAFAEALEECLHSAGSAAPRAVTNIGEA